MLFILPDHSETHSLPLETLCLMSVTIKHVERLVHAVVQLLVSCIRFLYRHRVLRTGCGCLPGKFYGKCYSVLSSRTSLNSKALEGTGSGWAVEVSSAGETKLSAVLGGHGSVKTRREVGHPTLDPRFVQIKLCSSIHTWQRCFSNTAQETHHLWALKSSCICL